MIITTMLSTEELLNAFHQHTTTGTCTINQQNPSEDLAKQSRSMAVYTPTYAEDLIIMKMAATAYKTNAKALKTSNSVSKELLATLR
jgi:hypothetical protein